MLTNNPYIGRIQELTRQLEINKTDELEQELIELKNKSFQFIQDILAKEVAVRIEDIKTKSEKIKIDYPKLTRQYKEVCILYRLAVELIDDVRMMKKEIRTEIQNRPKKQQVLQ